jgi:N-acetylmuramoyl-L-alanine amidase
MGLYILALCAWVLPCWSACSIERVFYHQGNMSDNLNFYLSSAPIVTTLAESPSQRKDQYKTVRFMLPKTMSREADFVKEGRGNRYRVTVTKIAKGKGPIDGVLITVSYDPRLIQLKLSRGMAIKEQPNFGIQLYHLDALAALANTHTIQRYTEHKPVIVIDQGHGGNDDGKVGCFNIKEKRVTAQVGIKLAKILRKRGYTVHTTRIGDQTVALDSRTTFANTIAQADLFISLHANSAPSDAARGIETYCIQSPPRFDHKLVTEFDRWKHQQSCALAHAIHNHAVIAARTTHPELPDRKVKTAISQVLLGTDMPSALIELGFLSNESDAKRLSSNSCQEQIAQAICDGVEAFRQQKNPDITIAYR